MWGPDIDPLKNERYLDVTMDEGEVEIKTPLNITYSIKQYPNLIIGQPSMKIYPWPAEVNTIPVRTISPLPVGEDQKITWDGKNDGGAIVDPGSYDIVIEALGISDGWQKTVESQAHKVTVFKVEIYSVDTPSNTANPPGVNSFVAPSDNIEVRARVLGAADFDQQLSWKSEPVDSHTGPSNPDTMSNTNTFRFRGSSLLTTNGSRTPNPPLGYDVSVNIIVNRRKIEDRVSPLPPIGQDERDIIRQEYIDYNTIFRPTREFITTPNISSLNTGNYSLIVEETPGNLETLLVNVRNRVNALLNNDVQVIPVGTTNLPPGAVVVSPGESIPMVGPLGDTDPEGDDRCAVPLINGRCPGSILAGLNGIAETHANNRNTNLSLTGIELSSAYRNPQRNRAVGSTDVDSRHTRGRALDIDPRGLSIPGKSSRQLMCIIEYAGDLVVGTGFSFTESGPSDVVDCNSNEADHVHIQN